MKFKLIYLFLGWAMSFSVSPDLNTVREGYLEASQSEEGVKKLYDGLTSIEKGDMPILVAYKGAVTTMMAGYAKGFKEKKAFFTDGKALLEYAIEADSENTEIRCIRLSVQENVPKITGYHKNRKEDKQFIIDHFSALKDEGAKKFIKGFATKSKSFTEAEKQAF